MGKQSTQEMLLKAAFFAAQKHRRQKRKGEGNVPYVNHVIEVAELLARVGGVTDTSILAAALLHDTVEDTETSFEEIEREFGKEVRDLVEEMTDDKTLTKLERKRKQVEEAAEMSIGGQQIKLADKISNINDIIHRPPPDWSLQRRRNYVLWGEDVVAGCRGANPKLEELFDRIIGEAWSLLGGEGERPWLPGSGAQPDGTENERD